MAPGSPGGGALAGHSTASTKAIISLICIPRLTLRLPKATIEESSRSAESAVESYGATTPQPVGHRSAAPSHRGELGTDQLSAATERPGCYGCAEVCPSGSTWVCR
mmetsp:Transcript_3994/g.9293  ORF Transcript_3994/g.9293 Transcript_3994/m.9293 type:complete len:106 (+) Transcript_3994:74-391(+)